MRESVCFVGQWPEKYITIAMKTKNKEEIKKQKKKQKKISRSAELLVPYTSHANEVERWLFSGCPFSLFALLVCCLLVCS